MDSLITSMSALSTRGGGEGWTATPGDASPPSVTGHLPTSSRLDGSPPAHAATAPPPAAVDVHASIPDAPFVVGRTGKRNGGLTPAGGAVGWPAAGGMTWNGAAGLGLGMKEDTTPPASTVTAATTAPAVASSANAAHAMMEGASDATTPDTIRATTPHLTESLSNHGDALSVHSPAHVPAPALTTAGQWGRTTASSLQSVVPTSAAMEAIVPRGIRGAHTQAGGDTGGVHPAVTTAGYGDAGVGPIPPSSGQHGLWHMPLTQGLTLSTPYLSSTGAAAHMSRCAATGYGEAGNGSSGSWHAGGGAQPFGLEWGHAASHLPTPFQALPYAAPLSDGSVPTTGWMTSHGLPSRHAPSGGDAWFGVVGGGTVGDGSPMPPPPPPTTTGSSGVTPSPGRHMPSRGGGNVGGNEVDAARSLTMSHLPMPVTPSLPSGPPPGIATSHHHHDTADGDGFTTTPSPYTTMSTQSYPPGGGGGSDPTGPTGYADAFSGSHGSDGSPMHMGHGWDGGMASYTGSYPYHDHDAAFPLMMHGGGGGMGQGPFTPGVAHGGGGMVGDGPMWAGYGPSSGYRPGPTRGVASGGMLDARSRPRPARTHGSFGGRAIPPLHTMTMPFPAGMHGHSGMGYDQGGDMGGVGPVTAYINAFKPVTTATSEDVHMPGTFMHPPLPPTPPPLPMGRGPHMYPYPPHAPGGYAPHPMPGGHGMPGMAMAGGGGRSGGGHHQVLPIDPRTLAAGLETRTTIMIRNVPNKYTQALLVEELMVSGFAGKFDFFYLPIDLSTAVNVGYAFVNFVHPSHVFDVYVRWHGSPWPRFNSRKVCELSFARIQGLPALVHRFRKSVVTESFPVEAQPLMYDSAGNPIHFPRD